KRPNSAGQRHKGKGETSRGLSPLCPCAFDPVAERVFPISFGKGSRWEVEVKGVPNRLDQRNACQGVSHESGSLRAVVPGTGLNLSGCSFPPVPFRRRGKEQGANCGRTDADH